ncbi:MAG: hypothetical protein ACYC3I_17000 [Gemmataceae bacterium]
MSTDVGPAVAGMFFSNQVDLAAIDEWLAEHSLERGRRYPHEYCPIDPHAHSHGDPVVVLDRGIFCFHCEGAGDGFRPWHRLLPTTGISVLETLVKHLTHWVHAAIIIEQLLGLKHRLARLVYTAALKAYHGADDPRISSVFTAGQDMIRQPGRWTSADGAVTYPHDIRGIIHNLPAAQYTVETENGRAVGVDAEKVVRFARTQTDLTRYGYPPLQVIPGVRVYSHHNAIDDEFTLAVPAAEYRQRPDIAPRYLPTNQRMALDEAWAVLEAVFPGLRRDYLELCLAAAGCAEVSRGQPYFILTTGPSGSAKSTTPRLAAGILGVQPRAIAWTPSPERWHQEIAEAADVTSLVTCNEFLKLAMRQRMTAKQALDPFLELETGVASHRMYVGPVPITRLPGMIVTDIRAPADIADDRQIGRRFVYVHLTRRVDWDGPCKAAGFGDAARLRFGGSRMVAAANAVLSHVIDAYFAWPQSLVEIAQQLGFPMLENADLGGGTQDLIDLFMAVCKAQPALGADASRFSGPGWKVVTRGSENDLAQAWERVCDSGWISSRRCDSEDWAHVLEAEIEGEISCDIRPHGDSKIGIRYRVGPVNRPTAVNEQIVSPENLAQAALAMTASVPPLTPVPSPNGQVPTPA